ncbi:hypothetical protein GPECTOR_105g98 [Gonium pectorale]|uniref:Uncharacterized protein n=1 Tax=Gonium pectorale TaxID=33097 RepID=A0A150FZM3_GONPE|nr:hypothetical protein GPECTOR_105g98 [Gonium pectorale]|eukprot:KXZ43066.1 hypothetical protein GPECTOR_105g98 [Gonium pectorale]
MQHGEQGLGQSPPAALSAAGRELLAGFAAGAANVTSGYPFDTIKVRLQSAAPGQYRGALHCLREVARREGLRRGLFRGMSSPLLGGTAETGVNYLCRMQQSGSAARYPGGPLQCLREVVAQEGGMLRGLMRGLGATLAREVPGNALFFTVYEALRQRLKLGAGIPVADGAPSSGGHWLQPQACANAGLSSLPCRVAAVGIGSSGFTGGPRQASLPYQPYQVRYDPFLHQLQLAAGRTAQEAALAILCGGTAGTVMWAAVIPIDTAKTRIQTATPGSAWDVGLRQHWRMLWREGGLASLYAGLTPTLARAFPANACQWLAWEVAMRGLRD